jgi:hypothetical protein
LDCNKIEEIILPSELYICLHSFVYMNKSKNWEFKSNLPIWSNISKDNIQNLDVDKIISNFLIEIDNFK